MSITLVPANKTTPEELEEYVETVRNLADRIEKGEILSLAWVATRAKDNQFETGWVCVSEIHNIEMVGQVSILKRRMIDDLED